MGNCYTTCIKEDEIIKQLEDIKEDNINIKIALKFPNGVKGISTNDDYSKFVEEDDINTWIQKLIKDKKYTECYVYNNEMNDKDHGSCGHSKGILLWNKDKIDWLIHSVPNFPEEFNLKENKISKIDHKEEKFGQSFIFVENIPYEQLENILYQLGIMHVNCVDKLCVSEKLKIVDIISSHLKIF